MTDDEIEQAYKALQKRKKEADHLSAHKSSIEYAKTLVGNPVVLEGELRFGGAWDDYPPEDDRETKFYELDEFLDKLPRRCKVRVTIEVLDPWPKED